MELHNECGLLSVPVPVEIPLDKSLVEQVATTVSTTDDPSLPASTFRMWVLGIAGCLLLSFFNTFFSYRTAPLSLTGISTQIATLPLGHFLAAVLPKKEVYLPFTKWKFSLNPGPFNMKEHVLITILASTATYRAGSISIINAIKLFYKRRIDFVPSLLLLLTSQLIGYGWAGLFRKYLVDPPEMWWPINLVQVSLFRTLHEKERSKGLSRRQFFLICLTASFSYYVLPNFLFPYLTSISVLCLLFRRSVTAQQIGSGSRGLGIGAFSLDWATISSFLGSPLVSPWFAIVNTAIGFALFLYVLVPLAYWGNIFKAKTFPIYSSDLFAGDGQVYNISRIVSNSFTLDKEAYKSYDQVHLSTLFAFTYAFGFAAIAATLSHISLFHGQDIWKGWGVSRKSLVSDVHTRLMRAYPVVPQWWFLSILCVTMGGAIVTVVAYHEQLQFPWWGLLLSSLLSFIFVMPIGVLYATTNQAPTLTVISEYIAGYLLPGQPISNVCFTTYSNVSLSHAVFFLVDFKLGHYMKIPPRAMFMVQFAGSVVAAIAQLGVAWWLLGSIANICDTSVLPPNSPWTCPTDRVFFDSSVIWGLVGPQRIFGSGGIYISLNWFFLGGFLLPFPVWLAQQMCPTRSWIRLINFPVMFTAAATMPPASPVNFTSWIFVGTLFNFYVYRYQKTWWRRYNYVLSAALDAGTAFLGVFLYFCLDTNVFTQLSWWGSQHGDKCPLASCPTAPGVVMQGCPV